MINPSLPLAQSAMSQASLFRPTGNTASTTDAQPPSTSSASFAGDLSKLTREAAKPESKYNPAQQEWLRMSKTNPELAERLIWDKAELPTGIVYDVSDGNVRIASTGELATKEYENRFEAYRQTHDRQLRTIYDTEKAKGTDPRDIVTLMYDFDNAAPDWFRTGFDPYFSENRTYLPDESSQSVVSKRDDFDVEALVEQLEELRADQKSLNRTSAAR